MPRVSEAHLAARRQQIIEAARVCFSRNGFHATSMQDVISEAGLSVGAFYRYFRSKEDLIQAIAEDVIGMISTILDQVRRDDPVPPPAEAMSRLLRTVEPQLGAEGVFPMALQVWAESLRNPQLADFVQRVYGTIRHHFDDLARRQIAAGHLPAGADPHAVGTVLFSLVPGYALQRLLLGEPDVDTYVAGLRALLPSA
ncbi:TetR/AcrR family transcriptional regulator [Catellatospora tritici]|uniref:TetR/AcrR family transcriptional regulator n=1 Tax=Catellatospora tritici TaxID=2851566 RepID=UPI001C2D11D0|nr:TetR/AcrR family transcriptional regulator [Catellatospora tritici]MBV1851656.1 TetR/AcrR family transcriptional regulator [Catellatospora tritici]